MKPITAALAACCLLVAPAGAYALPYTWAGDHDSGWCWVSKGSPRDNWGAGVPYQDYPGRVADRTDSATIDDGSNEPVCVLGCALSETLSGVTIDADSADADMQLTISSGANIDVNGDVQLIGDTGASNDAVLWYVAGTFDANRFDMDGHAVYGKAVLDIDATLTLASTDVDCTGQCDIEVAERDPAEEVTFKIQNLVVNAGAELMVSGETSTDAILEYNSIAPTGTVQFVGPLTVEVD